MNSASAALRFSSSTFSSAFCAARSSLRSCMNERWEPQGGGKRATGSTVACAALEGQEVQQAPSTASPLTLLSAPGPSTRASSAAVQMQHDGSALQIGDLPARTPPQLPLAPAPAPQ